MKKYISNFMMMAVMAVVTTSFASCGGDDSDDPLENTGQNTENQTMKVAYFVPCTDWSYTKEQVKTYMSQYNWLTYQNYNTNADVLTWDDYDYNKRGVREIQPFYEFYFSETLQIASVWYGSKTEEEFQYIVSETERVYSVTLERSKWDDESNPVYTLRSNGKNEKYISVSHNGKSDGATVKIYKDKPAVW